MQRRRDDRHCIDGGHAPPKHFVQGQPRGFVDPGGWGRFPHQHQGDGGLGTLRPQRTHPQPKALGGGVRGMFFQTPHLHVKGVARGGGAGHRAAQNVAGTPWTSFGVGDGAQDVAASSSATSSASSFTLLLTVTVSLTSEPIMKKLVPLESVRSPLRPRRRDDRVAVEGFAAAICEDIRAGVELLRYQCDCVGLNQPTSQSERSERSGRGCRWSQMQIRM